MDWLWPEGAVLVHAVTVDDDGHALVHHFSTRGITGPDASGLLREMADRLDANATGRALRLRPTDDEPAGASDE